jgi:competence ComEA-like helix-hairpin-helix protein
MKSLGKYILVIVGILVCVVPPAAAEKWSRRYIGDLPDSAFAAVETGVDGKKVRHLPHHNHLGEVDIPHLKSALSRIHQVKWMVPANFAKAKAHLEEHYRVYKQERAKARGLKAPVNINEASISELTQLPHLGEELAAAIIEYRKTHGGFKSTSELTCVPGIVPKILSDIEDLIVAE